MKITPRTILQHLLETAIIKRSRLFDKGFYLGTYPEVAKTSNNPILHYVQRGWREGKNPSPHFDTAYYLNTYPDVRKAGHNPLVHYIRKGRAEGRLPRQAMHRLYPRYPLWVKKYDTLAHKDKRQIRQKIRQFSEQPKFSIFIIHDEGTHPWIKQTLSSLQSQLYREWDATLFFRKTTARESDPLLSIQVLLDSRLSLVSYQDETELIDLLNKTLDESSGDFLGLLPTGSILSSHTLYLLANEIKQHTKTAILYTDEDQRDANNLRISPYFKPDWNPDLFLHQDFLNDFAIYHMGLVQAVGGIHQITLGSIVYDLAMRISEIINPEAIRHLPFALCHKPVKHHRQSVEGGSAHIAFPHTDLLRSHFIRANQAVTLEKTDNSGFRIAYPLPEPHPLVSIIIPTHNGHQILARCIESVFLHTSYENYELLIVDNQSDDPETLAYFNTLKRNTKVTLLPYHKPFNFSAINNHAAQAAQGEILVFLNNDVEVITPNWLTALVGHALRPQIGAVGVMLYYPDDTIQHAGVVLGLIGEAGHIYKGQPRGYRGVRNRAALVQNLTAVTGACMVVQKKKFFQLSGFDEENLPIAFNDIDLCLRLQQAGYRNLWTPHVELYHYESATRGSDEVPENKARFAREAEYIRNTFGDMLKADPAYNPNLSLDNTNPKLAFPPRVNKPWRS
jgi:GT2 family glycosyltransferase